MCFHKRELYLGGSNAELLHMQYNTKMCNTDCSYHATPKPVGHLDHFIIFRLPFHHGWRERTTRHVQNHTRIIWGTQSHEYASVSECGTTQTVSGGMWGRWAWIHIKRGCTGGGGYVWKRDKGKNRLQHRQREVGYWNKGRRGKKARQKRNEWAIHEEKKRQKMRKKGHDSLTCRVWKQLTLTGVSSKADEKKTKGRRPTIRWNRNTGAFTRNT